MIPMQKRSSAKYCGVSCKNRAANQRKQKKAVAEGRIEEGQGYSQVKKKADYKRFVESGDAQRVHDGALSASQAALLYGVTSGAVKKWMDTWRTEQELERLKGEWRQGWIARTLLPVAKLVRARELGLSGRDGTVEFETLIDELVAAFDVFGRYFFRLEGRRPIHKPYHLKWIRSILVAFATGGKQMILSPPRHGKSELLIRFVVWLIAMFPNIRIGWFCSAKDIAGLMLGAVKDHLENNVELIAAALPPFEAFKPLRSQGRPWSAKEIKVRQQSHVGQKSSSMLALGITSKFLSRDLDLIIIDDMEDYDSTRELGSRKYNKRKLVEINTRKEEHTAEVLIASRQHPDDIPQSVLQLEGTELAWKIIVERAHDDTCGLDPDDYDAHVDCMLFPEVRSYRWLMEKKAEADLLGEPGLFDMQYQNDPIPTEGIVFDMTKIRKRALNPSRDIGVEGLGAGRMVAGLDPASRGTQAAFAWHFVPGKLSMIDLETQKAGGFAGALQIMEEWAVNYEIRDWYYEDNAQQAEFFQDPRVRELKTKYGLTILPHTTGKNKQDPELGISSMAPWYHLGMIDLPYGTVEARRKVEMLLGQLKLWTSDGVVRKGVLTDIKMAHWFPFPRMVRWNRATSRQAEVERRGETSYPSVSRSGAVPWQTTYPRG